MPKGRKQVQEEPESEEDLDSDKDDGEMMEGLGGDFGADDDDVSYFLCFHQRAPPPPLPFITDTHALQ